VTTREKTPFKTEGEFQQAVPGRGTASLSWGVGDFLAGLSSRKLQLLTVLVVSQAAGLMSLVVLVGAGLCVKSLRTLDAIDPGPEPEDAELDAPRPGGWQRIRQLFR